jgi:hypothetical protein
MQKLTFFLFAIPILSIVVIGAYQFFDEMRKKRFVLERRVARAAEDALAGAQRRRYSDSVPPGTLRNSDTPNSGSGSDVSVPQANGV